MKIEINKLPKSEIEIKIEVSPEKWQFFLEEAGKELSKEIHIEGFRPGTAPLSLVEEKVGLGKILERAAQRCVQEYYLKAIVENNIEAIGQPEISILKVAKGNPFEFKARVSVIPSIDLPDYKEIASKVKRKKVSVEEKEIEDTLSWIQKSRAELKPKRGSSQKDDWVEIEYFSPEIEGGKKFEDAFILGKGRLVPGFEDNLIGMKEGEEKQFSLFFPENYNRKDLAGKKTNFFVKLKGVKKVVFPEMTDEFAKKLGNFESLEGLKKSIREGILMEKEKAEKERVRGEILEKISEEIKAEIPEILLKEEQKHLLQETKEKVKEQFGIKFEDYLKGLNKTEPEILDSFLSLAQKRIKIFLALREISKKEKITVSDEEVKKEVNNFLKRYDQAPDLDPQKLMSYTKERLINQKTIDFLESFVD